MAAVADGPVHDRTRETQQLDPAECRRLLATMPFGRLVFTEDALPAVHPVNFAMAGGDVIIRTGPGQKLAAARRGDVVAFEADCIDVQTRTGWSVLVIGHASVVHDIDELVAVLDPARRPWVRGHDQHVIRIDGGWITGRRLVLDHGDREAG